MDALGTHLCGIQIHRLPKWTTGTALWRSIPLIRDLARASQFAIVAAVREFLCHRIGMKPVGDGPTWVTDQLPDGPMKTGKSVGWEDEKGALCRHSPKRNFAAQMPPAPPAPPLW